jgi:DNA-binding PadR family transcriptional regulator
MPPNERLNPISYVILGTLATFGPRNPYELKQLIGDTIAYFWSFSHSQFYEEPARLAELGLLHEEQEDHGRRRRKFSITEAGRQALRQWFEEPTETRREIRDLGIVKLFFSEHADRSDIEHLIDQQIKVHREIRNHYQALHDRFAGRTDLGNRAITIEMGLLFEDAMLNFWECLELTDDGSVRIRSPKR